MTLRLSSLRSAPALAGRTLAAWLLLCGWTGWAGWAATPAAAAQRAADDDLPAASEYAYGFALETGGTATLYRAPLSLSVYRSTDDDRLRDSGVYNAADEPVPRVYEAPASAEREPAERRAVPFFGLSRAESRVAPDRLRLILERRGTRLRLDSTDRPPDAPGPAADLDAYIAEIAPPDRRGDEPVAPVVALHLDWPPLAGNFLGRLEVEASDDLAGWQPLAGGPVADLRREGSRIEKRSLELPPTRARYLRLRWQGFPDGWSLSGLEVEEARSLAPQTRRWVELGRDAAQLAAETVESDTAGADDGWIFDLGGAPPVDRFALTLPDDNTVVRARIAAWDAARGRWVTLHSGLFYRLRQEGSALASEPAAFPLQRTHRFKVTLESGRLGSDWGVRIGWRPDRLVFVAQGPPPYRLVAGRTRDRAESFPQKRVLGDRGILELGAAGGYGRAALGQRFEIAGPTSLERVEPVRWRIWTLWGVLILGVAFVGMMASRLLREGAGGQSPDG